MSPWKHDDNLTERASYSWMFKWSMSLSFSSFTIAIDKRRRLCAACALQKNFSSSSGVEHAVSVTRPGTIWRPNRRKKKIFRFFFYFSSNRFHSSGITTCEMALALSCFIAEACEVMMMIVYHQVFVAFALTLAYFRIALSTTKRNGVENQNNK